MDNNYEEVLMSKAVWYYYFDNMTQQQISDFLGIPRMRVVKLLNKARSTGAIQFKIKDDSANRMELERKLAEAYALKDTFVVSTPPDDVNTNENIALIDTDNLFVNFADSRVMEQVHIIP